MFVCHEFTTIFVDIRLVHVYRSDKRYISGFSYSIEHTNIKKTGQNQVTQERRGEVLSTSPKFDVSNRQSILSLSLSLRTCEYSRRSRQTGRQATNLPSYAKRMKNVSGKRREKETKKVSFSRMLSGVLTLTKLMQYLPISIQMIYPF